jgi:hypothetical protein
MSDRRFELYSVEPTGTITRGGKPPLAKECGRPDMLSIVRQKFGVPINEIFFASDPNDTPSRSPVSFFVQASTRAPGFYPFKTQVIDLSQDSKDLFASLSSNTRYKIRRAEREGIIPVVIDSPSDDDVGTFSNFFDEFARQKQQPLCNRNKLHALRAKQALLLTTAHDQNKQFLVGHAYVADTQIGRLRLLYSASHFRGSNDTEERNKIGRANRLLHWFDIESAKQRGFSRYDLGGVPIDESDPEKNAIARFKSEFGGEHVIEYNGYLSTNRLLQRCIPTLRRIFT